MAATGAEEAANNGADETRIILLQAPAAATSAAMECAAEFGEVAPWNETPLGLQETLG